MFSERSAEVRGDEQNPAVDIYSGPTVEESVSDTIETPQ